MTQTATITVRKGLIRLVPRDQTGLSTGLGSFRTRLTSARARINGRLTPLGKGNCFIFRSTCNCFRGRFKLAPLNRFAIGPRVRPNTRHLRRVEARLIRRGTAYIFTRPRFEPTIIRDITQKASIHVKALSPLKAGVGLNGADCSRFLDRLTGRCTDYLGKSW